MMIEMVLIAGFGVLIAVAMWAGAGAVYEFQKGLKDDNSPIYKLIAYDPKFIEDRSEWIKRYRRTILAFYALIVVIAVVASFI